MPYAKTARILIAMSVPGNILFIFAADYINMNTTTVTWVFMLSYLIASLIQVSPRVLVMVKGILQCESFAGHVAAVHCAHHCARYVEVEDRSGQFGYTISDIIGRSIGQQSAGSCVALYHGS